MNPEMLKGHLDAVVLSVVEGGAHYGYAIIKEISQRSHNALNLPEGTIYPTLHRWRDSLQSTVWGDALLAVDRYAFLIAVILLTVGLISGSRYFPRIRVSDGPKSDLVTIAAPSILILISALAIIGSIFVLAGPGVMSLANYGLGSVTFAALVTVCIVILARLLNLVVAYVTSIKSPSLPKELF